jgi:3-oxoacyl-[acyl-carrier protein] reductase
MSTSSGTVDLGFNAGDVMVVTGAGSGIGRAIALRGTQLGLRVSAWDLREEGLAGLAEEVGAAGGELHTHVGDVADAAAVAEGFDAVRERFGVPAFLVNNAGPPSSVPLDFDEAVRISVGSVRAMTEAWAREDLPARAAMVATSSVAGNRVGTESDWYSASKAALMGYVRHLAAHRAGEFRANAVAPGMTDTPRLTGFAESETGQRVLGRIPLGRMGTPDEMAWPALFLLSPLAAYVNGLLLVVDGGWTVTQ